MTDTPSRSRPLRALVLDDDPRRVAYFADGLEGACMQHVPCADSCLRALRQYPWDVAFLDHDLGWSATHYGVEYPGNGSLLTMSLAAGAPPLNRDVLFVVHSLNTSGAARMVTQLTLAKFNVRRCAFAWHERAALQRLVTDSVWTARDRSDVMDFEMACRDVDLTGIAR